MVDRTHHYQRLRQAYETTFSAAQSLDPVNRAAVVHVIATSSRAAARRLHEEGGNSGVLGDNLASYANSIAQGDPVQLVKKHGPMAIKISGWLGVTGILLGVATAFGTVVLVALGILRSDATDALLLLPSAGMYLLLRSLPAVANGIKSALGETMHTTDPAKNLLRRHLDGAESDFFRDLGANVPARWELQAASPVLTVTVALAIAAIVVIILAMIVSAMVG